MASDAKASFHLPGGLIPGCLRSGLSCLPGGFLLLRIFSVGSSVSPPSGFLQLGVPSFSFRVSSTRGSEFLLPGFFIPGCLMSGLSWFNWWVSFAPDFLCW